MGQKKLVTVFVHGWGTDGPFISEAIECAREGKTIEETVEACEDLAQRTFGKVGFMNSEMYQKMNSWRPGMFPAGFEIPEGHQFLSGPPAGVRADGVPLEKRTAMMMAPIGMASSTTDAFEKAAKHIKSGLEPGQKIANLTVPCVGRPDIGHDLIRIMEEAGIEIVGTPQVYSEGMIGVIFGAWG